jgi:hypothetical protein
VTPQTIFVCHALRVVHLPNLVRLMAVDTRGKNVRLLLPQLPSNDLAVDQLDLRMALCAGDRDVLPRD